MKAVFLPSFVIVLALILTGCGEEPLPEVPAITAETAPDAATGPAATAPGPVQPAADVEAVTVPANAVVVGSALGANQAATAPKPAYTAADTVHASASTKGRSGATAHVYWTYQNGTSHKEEEKPVAGDVVTFAFSQADGMVAGNYNVQIDLDGVPIGIADFKVE